MLVVLDLVGTFAFALNGALTAVRAAHVDIVGVVTLGMITAVGGGIIRDILLGALPPATFVDWRYLTVAAAGGLLAFLFSRRLSRFSRAIDVLDAAGLSLFAVTGAGKALELGVGPMPAIILGTVTAVGGGTVRDVLIRQVPGVLSSGLYAIPALLGAALVVITDIGGVDQALGALGAAAVCFATRMAGLLFGLDAPKPPGTGATGGVDAERARGLASSGMERNRPLWPHPKRREIALESASAVLALVFAITLAILGVWWVWWTLVLLSGAGSAVVAWVHWRTG